jgi:hypothetical protein
VRRVGEHVCHRPLHIGAQAAAEFGIVRKIRVVRRRHEAGDKAAAQVVVRARIGVQIKHLGIAGAGLGVARRPTEHLSPVTGQPFDVLRMSRMGERVVQHRVLQAPLVVRGDQLEER